MAKITLNYDTTGLDITISVLDRETGTEEFTGTMTEIGTTAIYTYDFTEENKDYVYVASCLNHDDLKGSLIYSASSGLTPTQESQLQQVYDRVDMKVSNVGSGGWGYNSGVSYQNVEYLLKKFFEKFKEEQEEQRQKELELLLRETELNEKITRARSEKSKIELNNTLKEVKQELDTLKEQNKLNKVTSKKGFEDIMTKFKKQELKEEERIKQEKEIQKQLEDNEKLLQDLLEEVENEEMLDNLLKEVEDDDLLEKLLEEVEKEVD